MRHVAMIVRAFSVLLCTIGTDRASGQYTIYCERIDTVADACKVFEIRSRAQSTSASTPYGAAGINEIVFGSSDENYASESRAASAAANGNEAYSLLDILAENPTTQGAATAVPQITLGVGGNQYAHANPSDANGSALAAWYIDPYRTAFDFDGFTKASGNYEVLGDNETGNLFGTIDLILTINGSGNWDVFETGNEDTWEWRVECGSSWLEGDRPYGEDGWDVGGALHTGGDVELVDEFWPDNVNELIHVDEPVESGYQRGLLIYIENLGAACSADDSGPTASGLLVSLSFSSSFEVESD